MTLAMIYDQALTQSELTANLIGVLLYTVLPLTWLCIKGRH